MAARMAWIQKVEGKRGVRWKAVIRRRGYPAERMRIVRAGEGETADPVEE